LAFHALTVTFLALVLSYLDALEPPSFSIVHNTF
jgi:hypothetical protein